MNISGAKNAVLPIMTAALMAEGESVISRVPDLRDTRTMIKLMEIVGAKCSMEGNCLKIDADSVNTIKELFFQHIENKGTIILSNHQETISKSAKVQLEDLSE